MKNLLLLFLTVASMSVSAQINVIKPQEKEEPEETIQVYDSLMSLNSQNAMQHVGQTLFLRGNKRAKDLGGFLFRFYTKPAFDFIEVQEYVYKPIESKEDGEIITAYDSIIGRYYLVTNIEKSKHSYLLDDYCMELKDVDNGDIFYFIFKGSNKSFDDDDTKIFLTVGYYQKMMQRYLGREFYSTANFVLEKADSGEEAKVPFKTKFKCIDFGVYLGEDDSFYAIMESPTYGKIINYVIEKDKNYISDFCLVSEYNAYVKRYGSYYTNLILKGQIVNGMTKEMVRKVWGDPKKINTTSGSFGVHEQWVYSFDRYVYFENGKVTAIQN